MVAAVVTRDFVTIDETFTESIGEFGRGQQFLFVLISGVWLPAAVQTLVMVFTSLNPVHEGYWRCREGLECGPETNLCKMPRDDWAWTHQQLSIVSEWDLVCERGWMAQLVNSGFFLGFLLGAAAFGWLADAAGRKRALFAACATAALFGNLSAHARGYWAFLLLRSTTGVGVAGLGLVSHVLMMEWIGPSWRGCIGIASHYFFPAGVCLLTLMAWTVPDWRQLTTLSTVPTLLTLLAWPAVGESPRWLLVQDRADEAAKQLSIVAAWNGTSMPDAPLGERQQARSAKNGQLTSEASPSIIREPALRSRLLATAFGWTACSLVYYGLSLVLGELAGSLYLNNLLGGLVEFPAFFTANLLIDRSGRRRTLIAFLACGFFCTLLCAMLPPCPLQSALAVGAKFGASAAFTVLFLYTGELFPTTVRSRVLGANSMLARAGGILAPAALLIGDRMRSEAVPFMLFAILLLVAASLASLLPETRSRPLPETIDDLVPTASDTHQKPLHSEVMDSRPTLTGVARMRARPGHLAVMKFP